MRKKNIFPHNISICIFIGMLLPFIFIQYICLVSAYFGIFDFLANPFKRPNYSERRRKGRAADEPKPVTCEEMSNTEANPYVVMFLYKTSGRFLGMGCIIDRKTVMTAIRAIKITINAPQHLLVLAGYRSPWWGRNAQVKHVEQIYTKFDDLVLITVKSDFLFGKTVNALEVPLVEYTFDTYGIVYAVFGLQRSGWDLPGDFTTKNAHYVMAIEWTPQSQASCLSDHGHLDTNFNSNIMVCLYHNGSWSWGCIGSPTVGKIKKTGKYILAGILYRTSSLDKEVWHFSLLLSDHYQWVRAHSLLGFKPKIT